MLKKRILITGATGFLGSHLTKALAERGDEITILKRSSSDLTRLSSLVSKLDVLEIEGLDFPTSFLKGRNVDAVIHTATCYGRNGESPSEIFSANTAFPLKLLESSVQAGVKIFINTDTILDKYLNLYSLSKNQFLQWGRYFSKQNKMNFINMKLEHFYGPGDDNSKFTSHVITSCILNAPLLKLTPGDQRRDFVYIDDVVAAYLAVLKGTDDTKKWFGEYEVGSGNPISIREFVEKVHKLTSSKTKLEFGAFPYRDGEVMNSQANISALELLKWDCKYNLDLGLELTIESYKQ